MYKTLIEKLVTDEKVTKDDIYDALNEICESVHSSCDTSCPVNRLNGGEAPDTAGDFNINRGCDCFKNGEKMYKFIKAHYLKEGSCK